MDNNACNNLNTEELIKSAAKSIFLKKGLAGARLQEISDAAGIGRTALHYYFRNKEKLFEVVFREAFEEMHNRVSAFAHSNKPALEMMKMFVSDFYDMALKDPEVDLFLINEFNQHPDTMRKVFCKDDPQQATRCFLECIKNAVSTGELKGDHQQIMLTVMSLCAHPFAAKSMIMSMMYLNEAQYIKLLHERKDFVLKFLDHAFS